MFSYTVQDASGATSTTTLTITITGTNDAPVAVADTNGGDPVVESGVNPGNTPFAGDASAAGNVLANDTDVDTGDTLTVAAVNGSAVNVGDGGGRHLRLGDDRQPTAATPTRSTTPIPTPRRSPQGESVDDVFTYTVTDGTARPRRPA